MLIKIEIILCT